MNPDVDLPNRRRPGTGPDRPTPEETAESLREQASRASAPPGGKSLTIGAVCKQLDREFPDISISKIRYLEDQKLLSPRRTQGGYRLYTPADVARLRTILRLQRDEFLPLRVIRQELAAGRADSDAAPQGGAPDPRTLRRASVAVKSSGAVYSLGDVLDDTGADAKLVRELEEFGVI
ncbi:MAG TPA: MerR family transcriptional regulator, partial [Thermoleophilaceae bacterium]|nr:MerR family transcriptional regulator [Thermoleophilaceae bacterium]